MEVVLKVNTLYEGVRFGIHNEKSFVYMKFCNDDSQWDYESTRTAGYDLYLVVCVGK